MEAEVPAQVQVEHQVEVRVVLEGVVGRADEAGAPHLFVLGLRLLVLASTQSIDGYTEITTRRVDSPP